MDRTVREISIMTDRTKIADALERMAVEAEDGYSIPAGPSEVTTFRDAARLLRPDPDTDRRNILPGEHAKPDGTWCPYLAPSNEAGVWVCMKCGNSGGVSTPDTDPNTLADRLDNGWMLTNSEMRAAADGLRQYAAITTAIGDIIGPCDCTSDELASEARRLLDAATPGPWERPSSTANWFTVPQPIQIDEADWGQEAQENGAMCGYRIGTLADERAWRYADAELIAAAPRLIAALLERAVTAEAATTLTGAADYIRKLTTERDAERAAREQAEAEARQLREAIEFTASALDFEIDGDKFPRSVRQSLLDQLAVIDAAVAEGAEDAEDTE